MSHTEITPHGISEIAHTNLTKGQSSITCLMVSTTAPHNTHCVSTVEHRRAKLSYVGNAPKQTRQASTRTLGGTEDIQSLRQKPLYSSATEGKDREDDATLLRSS
ncbi:UNVERIFIED_CONTAM: hypothetical protein Slati_2393900 [Sesamum latifolium]|uniref:Uncharacterized protein n=1 Tax=Sesamum latifolium TaxID=2727402 RepID=A0AAW2WCS8_9LAMI